MRTKSFFIGFVCCVVLQVNAQTDNTIVSNNSSWATLIYELGAENMPCCVNTQYVYFDGDSTVAAISYKKVFSCNDSLHQNIKYEGLIREENKKTYFIPVNSETEYLLYDFSLEEGMSFEYSFLWTQEPTASFYVSTVDFMEINGTMRKYMKLTLFGRIIDIWIEEIGSLSGILYPMYKGFLAGNERLLLCYYQNNELIYKNSAYSECYYDKAEDITSVQAIIADNCSIFPNPVDDILNISCLNNAISRIEIFDNLGRRVYSQTNKDKINVSSFSKGLYLLKTYDTNGQISVFKIIKK